MKLGSIVAKSLKKWSGRRDLNSGPLASQARNINHLQTFVAENKRVRVVRFGRQMDAKRPNVGDLDSGWTPLSLVLPICPGQSCAARRRFGGKLRDLDVARSRNTRQERSRFGMEDFADLRQRS